MEKLECFGGKFVIKASKESGKASTLGAWFDPFEEVKKDCLVIATCPQDFLARLKFSNPCETTINEQVKVETMPSMSIILCMPISVEIILLSRALPNFANNQLHNHIMVGTKQTKDVRSMLRRWMGRNWREKNPNYPLTFASHPLGSRVIALLTMMVVHNGDELANNDWKRIRCYATAPTMCMLLNLAMSYVDLFNSIML
ncbi:hypothetical protein AAG906_003144 [Vitis piasezkii]